MGQIDIRVNKETDRIFQYLSKKRKIPKAILVREILLENFREKVLSQLLMEYEQGQISLKTIGSLLEMTPQELFKEISVRKIECPISPEIDDYTRDVTDRIIERLKISEK